MKIGDVKQEDKLCWTLQTKQLRGSQRPHFPHNLSIMPPRARTGRGGQQQRRRRKNWGPEQDQQLWHLYHTGEIDPRNNDPTYLLWCQNEYFGEFGGRARKIRRQRDKNAVRINQEELLNAGECNWQNL